MSEAWDLCRLAWGTQAGWISLSVRDPSVGNDDPGYWRDHLYEWPAAAAQIEEKLDRAARVHKDVYWAPAVFNGPKRSKDGVAPVQSLWADLDEIDPHDLPKTLKPTAAWQTSPGRWQAIWKLVSPVSPAVQGELNRRLTYAIGADKGGWDITQVLRLPGTRNHKYKNRPPVELLYLNGHTLDPVRLADDLPDLKPLIAHADTDTLPPRDVVLKRHGQALNARAKELIKARHAQVGTRSDRLWELACLLAERGLIASEIAAITQGTVWNKFQGRTGEIAQLLAEAAKAVDHVGVVEVRIEEDAFEEVEDVAPQTWSQFDAEHKAIRWLVADVWGESEVGFISGLPKSYKSWLALDLAVSVATGQRFLDTFQCLKQNVLLIQEEDPKPILQDRLVKIGAAKGLIWAKPTPAGFRMQYALPDNLFIISNQGFTIDEEWLEQLEAWIIERDIGLCILDPLMMIAGGNFDEFKAFEFMNKVLKPLKRVRARTRCAIVLVHHHLKASTTGGARDMYGSVALWAWEEAALHLQLPGTTGKVIADRFSKHALLPPLTIDIGDVSEAWAPTVAMGASSGVSLLDLLSTSEAGATAEELEVTTGISKAAVTRQLKALESQGKVVRAGSVPSGGRPRVLWKMKLDE